MRTTIIKQAAFFFILIGAAGAVKAQLAAGMASLAATEVATAPLDVHLTASISSNSHAITWHALKAVVVRRYELEKSVDGENFGYITAMPGKAGHYRYQDELASETTSYYRVKIITANGISRYSKIISVTTKAAAAQPKLLPTQLNNKLYIWVPANTTVSNARILDATGRLLAVPAVTHSNNLADMAIGDLPAGVYSVALTTNQGITVHLKFAKAK